MLNITSIYHGVNNVTITENQLAGILTGNKEEVLKLSTFDSIKNFFVKVFNQLPGVNLFDKQQFLDNLYDNFQSIIHPVSEDIASSHHSPEITISDFWKLFSLVLGVVEKNEAEKFQFRLESYPTPSNYHNYNTTIDVIFAGQHVAKIEFDVSKSESNKLSQLASTFLRQQGAEPQDFALDFMKMDTASPFALFLPAPEIDTFYQP